MAAHNETGRNGEEAACIYLARRGYRLLERNWRCGKLEVDIIAEYRGVIVFVEVKSSRYDDYGDPVDRVTQTKRIHLIKAANTYIRMKHLFQNARFDVISVVGEEEPLKVVHIEDAFTVAGTKMSQGW